MILLNVFISIYTDWHVKTYVWNIFVSIFLARTTIIFYVANTQSHKNTIVFATSN